MVRACFDCLPREEQEASRAVWAALSDTHHGLQYGVHVAEREVREGQFIRTRQTNDKGVRIVMPTTLFRLVVHAIHADRVDRGEA